MKARQLKREQRKDKTATPILRVGSESLINGQPATVKAIGRYAVLFDVDGKIVTVNHKSIEQGLVG